MPGGMAKTKGTTIVALVKFLRRHREEAAAALPAHLRHYLEERVHVSSWYPEQDLLELARVMAPMLGKSVADPYDVMGRFTARDHLEGAYSHLFEGVEDPLAIPARAFALWATMHDSGRLETFVEGSDALRVELAEFALPSREMCAIVGGYLTETMSALGFVLQGPARKLACRLEGAPRCSWRCSFAAGEGRAAVPRA
jgi:hypothetical protein